jgi:hypothetical protein
MPSYSWWQAIRILAGQEPGAADLPSLELPCLESQPAAIVSLLADGAAVVLGVPFGGDVHEEIPAAAWRRIRIELRTSRSKARPFETVAALPGPVLGDVFASRGWTDLQVPERELARLVAAAERLACSTERATVEEIPAAEPPTIKAEHDCTRWLKSRMLADPDAPVPKGELRGQALELFPRLSDRGFTRSWSNAVQATGAHRWSKAGRRGAAR